MIIKKAGLLASFQDGGRKGFQHMGIGPGGCMDLLAFTLANLIAGNKPDTAVLEMAFPAPTLYFEKPVEIVLTGADFSASCYGVELPLYRLINLPAKSTLVFHKKFKGQWGYLAVVGGWQLPEILDSYSTHLKAGFGGFQGRALKKGDEIKEAIDDEQLDNLANAGLTQIDKVQQDKENHPNIESWFVDPAEWYLGNYIRVIAGPEWNWLSPSSQNLLQQSFFTIGNHSDRMALSMEGSPIEIMHKEELLSSGVLRGTVQCLPNGQLLILMADHQTTGGYPRVLQVAAVDLSKLAQKAPGQAIKFALITVDAAQDLLQEQEDWLQQVSVGMELKRLEV